MENDAVVTIQFLTIVITILGFAATAQRQRELLDNQKKIEKYRFVFDERNKQLREFSEYIRSWQADASMIYAYKILKQTGKPAKEVTSEYEVANARAIRSTMAYTYYRATCYGLWQKKYKIKNR